jgi:hypothetical protein
VFLLCGDEYIKFSDMTDDLIDWVRYFKINVETEPGIEFLSLRRKVDMLIIKNLFINSEEAEESRKELVMDVCQL